MDSSHCDDLRLRRQIPAGDVAEQREILLLLHLQTSVSSSMSNSAIDKASKTFFKKIKPACNTILPVDKMSADCKCVNCSKSDSRHKMKKLRSRKERNHMRDGGKEASKTKPCHHHCSHQSSKDISHALQCCHNSFVPNRFPHPVPVAREPSVITDSRLIGHHGLFNHKIQSIDIERLLSEQRKVEKNGQIKKNSSAILSLSAVGNPSPIETKMSDSTDDEAGASKEENQPKTFTDCQDQESKTLHYNSQVSDLTPGQRPKDGFNFSDDSNRKYSSSKQSSSDVVLVETKEAQPSLHEPNTESLQTPSVCEENVNTQIRPIEGQRLSSVERTPKNPPLSDTKRKKSHPSPLQSASLPTASSSNNIYEHPNLNTDCVAMSVKAVAASLCKGISFSRLRNRDLVEESREALMTALRQQHGAHLKKNLSEVWRYLHLDSHVQKEVPEMCLRQVFFEEGPFCTDELTTPFKVTSLCFAASTFDKARKPPCNWNTTDWSKCDETAEWLGTPVKNRASLDATFSRRCSPPFCMDFDFPNAFPAEKEHLFPVSPTPSCRDGLGRSFDGDNSFVRTTIPQFPVFETTQNFMNDTKPVRHRCSFTNDMNTHHSFGPHLSSESVSFPDDHSSFEMYNHSFDQPFSDRLPRYQQDRQYQSYSHFRQPLAPSTLTSHHLDLGQFPPSYMLEHGPSLSSSSSFLSPEHWSFPPMKLY